MRQGGRATGPQPSRPAGIYLASAYGVHVRNTSGPGRDRWATLVGRAREAAGLTKVAMAQRIGVDRATITRWEQGVTRPESADVVQRVADLLGLDLDEALAAAGLRPSEERRQQQPREQTDPDVLAFYKLLADPDVPASIKDQARAMLRLLAEMADAAPRPQRRRRGVS